MADNGCIQARDAGFDANAYRPLAGVAGAHGNRTHREPLSRPPTGFEDRGRHQPNTRSPEASVQIGPAIVPERPGDTTRSVAVWLVVPVLVHRP